MFYVALADSAEGKQRIEYLYHKYRKQMFCVANRILNDCFDAEDAVHNAFVGVFSTVSKVPDNEQYERAYMLTAARNAAIDIYNKNARSVTFEIEIDQVYDDEVLKQVIASENREMLSRAIARLPDKYRDVLLMQQVYNLKVSEIAAAFGRKTETVEKQLSRARALLIKFCLEEGMVLENGKITFGV